MLKLKLFEGYNEYYQEISHEEVEFIDFETFDNSEINILKDLYDDVKIAYYRGVMISYNYLMLPNIYIYKCSDEWYICYYYLFDKKYYKCDQMEGLIKLLKDIC